MDGETVYLVDTAYDANAFFNEVIDSGIHRAQFAQTLSISHPLEHGLTLSGELWHFTQPFLAGHAVGNLWAFGLYDTKESRLRHWLQSWADGNIDAMGNLHGLHLFASVPLTPKVTSLVVPILPAHAKLRRRDHTVLLQNLFPRLRCSFPHEKNYDEKRCHQDYSKPELLLHAELHDSRRKMPRGSGVQEPARLAVLNGSMRGILNRNWRNGCKGLSVLSARRFASRAGV